MNEQEEFEKQFGIKELYDPEPEEIVRKRIEEINKAIRDDEERMRRELESGQPTAENYNLYLGRKTVNRSSVFKAGERVAGTMLTVLGPGFRNRWGQYTWQKVLCHCDCGKEVEVPYAYLAQKPGKFSCGCARRPRKDTRQALRDPQSSLSKMNGDLNFSDMAVQHHQTLRRLTILFRDETYKLDLGDGTVVLKWIVLLECCGETFELRTVLKTPSTLLKALYHEAGNPCTNCTMGHGVEPTDG